MKTLTEFINNPEDLHLDSQIWDTTSAHVISRNQMLQIDPNQLAKRLDQLQINYTVGQSGDVKYRPTQIDFDREKVNQIKTKLTQDPESVKIPVVVSADGYVVDGHHRYLASAETNIPVPVMKVLLDLNKLHKLLVDMEDLL